MAEEPLTDDEQIEELKRLTREYAPVIVLGAALGVAGLFGWRYYQTYKTDQALKAASQFTQMTVAMQANDGKKARSLAEGILKDYGRTPYADQARLALARMDIEESHDAEAVAPLTAVMNESKDSQLAQIARLRLARVLIDLGKSDEALNLVADTSKAGSFAGHYHELQGDALAAKKDVAGAVAQYKLALQNPGDGGADSAIIEMKLADLGASANAPTSPAKVK
jgi:predicted negative regulator of RcsB-dependent stress response